MVARSHRPGGHAALFATCLILAGVLLSTPAAAQSAGEFYKGKRLDFIIGYEPAESYDTFGRLLARHLGAHIPGNPNVVVRNKPGAGSLLAANSLFREAPKDGSTIGMVTQSLYFMQIVGQPNIEYDAPKFNWVGRITGVTDLVIVWHQSPVKTIEDAKKMKASIAVGGAVSGSTFYVNFMNAMLGTKLEAVRGYTGAGPMLAMERGEIDGTGSVNWFGLQATKPDWIRDRQINILVQIGLTKAPGLEKIPLFPDLATNDRDRKILVALASTDEIGRSVLAPPDIPADRLATLRRGFDSAVASEPFLSEAKTMKVSINPMTGENLGKLVFDSGNGLTPEMVSQIKTMAGLEGSKP